MANQELLNYINNCIKNGLRKDDIYKILLDASWKKEDIDSAYLEIEPNHSQDANNPLLNSSHYKIIKNNRNQTSQTNSASEVSDNSFVAIIIGSIIIAGIACTMFFCKYND